MFSDTERYKDLTSKRSFKRQRSPRDYPFKKRKFYECSSMSNSDEGNSGGALGSHPTLSQRGNSYPNPLKDTPSCIIMDDEKYILNDENLCWISNSWTLFFMFVYPIVEFELSYYLKDL